MSCVGERCSAVSVGLPVVAEKGVHFGAIRVETNRVKLASDVWVGGVTSCNFCGVGICGAEPSSICSLGPGTYSSDQNGLPGLGSRKFWH